MRLCALALVCLVGAGGKCVEHDPALDYEPAAVDGGEGVLCPNPDEALIGVEEYAYPILCGCREPPWVDGEGSRVCTIPLGRTVVWTFGGSREHNVQSTASDFEGSDDRASGLHRVTFDAAGEYPFKCTIHGSLMTGYTVVVVDEE